MGKDLLAEQVIYYRRRAAEYDQTAYGDLAAARERISRLIAAMQPSGRVLEIACGTGMWTEALMRCVTSLTAIDTSPEAVAIARKRVGDRVTFRIADVYSWSTDERFDVVFFAGWLSHVPRRRFGPFWRSQRRLLAEDGRVLFVDEHVDQRHKETYVHDQDEIIERRLTDGSTFRIVKNFVDPEQLHAQLLRLGWESEIHRDGNDWIVGDARPRPAVRP